MADEYDAAIDQTFGKTQATPADPYDTAIDDMQQGNSDAFKQSMWVGTQKDPDQQAKVMDLSNQTGVPASLVERNYDEVDRQNKINSIDYDVFQKDSPKLSEWLQDPNNAAVAHDDLDNLQKHEQLVKEVRVANSYLDDLKAGYQNSVLGLYSRGEMPDIKLPDDPSLVESLIAQIGTLVPDLPVMGVGGFIGGVAGATTAAAAVSTGRKASLPGLAAAAMFGSGAGASAGAFAFPAALRTALTESYQNGEIKTLPDLIDRAEKIAWESTKQAAVGLVTWASGGTAELLGGGTVAKLGAEVAGMTIAGKGVEGEIPKPRDFIEGLLLVGGMHAANAGATKAADYASSLAEAKKTERLRDFYLALGDTAEASKLRERLPEAHQDMVSQITKDSPVENIYIPVDAAEKYFQSSKLDGDVTMAGLGVTDAYNVAKQTGADIKIPLATWVDKVVGTDHYKALADDIKFDPMGMTFNQAEIQKSQVEEQMKAASEAAQTPEAQTADQSAKEVGRVVADQLRAAGHDPKAAGLYESAFRSLGERTGRDPLELFNEFKLRIGNGEITTGDGSTFNQEPIHGTNVVDASDRFAQAREEAGSNPPPEAPENPLERFLARFGENDPEIPGIHAAQSEDAIAYKDIGGKRLPVGPNFEAKLKAGDVLGKDGISQPHKTGKNANIEQLPWMDDKYKVTRDALKNASGPVTIHTSSDLIAKGGYIEAIPEGSKVFIHALTGDAGLDRTLFPGNASQKRLEIAFLKLKSTGVDVRMIYPKSAEEVIEASGLKGKAVEQQTGMKKAALIKHIDEVLKATPENQRSKLRILDQSPKSELESARTKKALDEAFNGEDALKRYAEMEGTAGGLHIDPDKARSLYPPYAESREGAIVHLEGTGKPSAEFADRALDEQLKKDPGPVIMTAGGSASGKTEYAKKFAQTNSDATAVFDTTAANYETVKARIQRVLDAGHQVVFDYIYAPFGQALEGNRNRFKETGRLVDPHTMAYTHAHAIDGFIRLQEDFKDNPDVSFGLFQRNGETLLDSPLENADKLRYNQGEQSLRSATRALEKRAKEALKNETDEVRTTKERFTEAQNQGDGEGNVGADSGSGTGRPREGGSLPGEVLSEGSGTPEVKKYEQSAPAFYSKLTKTIEEKMPNSAPVDQVRGIIKDMKPEERKWSGIDEFLKGKEKVAKEDLVNFLRGNQLEIKEITKGAGTTEEAAGDEFHIDQGPEGSPFPFSVKDSTGNSIESFKTEEEALDFIDSRGTVQGLQNSRQDAAATKFSQYTLPGGENYREILFTLPAEEKPISVTRAGGAAALVQQRHARALGVETDEGLFKSSHFEEPNVLAHTRLNDRVDSEGKRVLFMEELQSDWHQAGRKKGYKGDGDAKSFFGIKDEAWNKLTAEEKQGYVDEMKDHPDFKSGRGMVPDAPFKKTWHEFVLKRLIREAAEKGYDKIAWTTGEQQAERYDLSKQISEIRLLKDNETGNETLYAYNLDGDSVIEEVLGGDKTIEHYIGKEAAQKLESVEYRRKNKNGFQEKYLKGVDLKVGGEGMKGFYDKIIPDFLNKFAKKYGARVGESELDTANGLNVEYEYFGPAGWDLTAAAIDNIIDEKKETWPVTEQRQGREVVEAMYDKDMTFDEAMREHGSPSLADKLGATYKDISGNAETKVHSLEITPALKKAALEEGFSMFQGGDQGPRGQIQIGPAGVDISLLKTADQSTFFHETGHFYLEVMSHLASQEDTPQQIKDDFATVQKWVGAEPGQKFTTEQHEAFARGFEAYLMEGRAPSPELRSAFARFKVWLIAVYRHIKSLNVELSPDIRGVMDRLLATDDQISRAQTEQGMVPLFADPEKFGLTGEKAERYVRARDEARQAAEDQVNQKLMADFQREKDASWQKQRSQIRGQVDEEVGNQKIYRALSIIQRAKLPDGSPLPEGMEEIKLSRKILVEQYGKDFLKKLPRPYVYATEGGLHPDLAAELLGFESGDDLVTQIANAQKKDSLVDQMTDVRMNELHPDMLTSGELPEEAMKAVHNEKRAQLLRLELEHLASNDMPVLKEAIRKVARRVPTEKMVRDQASKIISTRKVSDLSPYLFQRAEAKAAKEAGELLAKGDLDGAFLAKQKELLNHELYRAANSAQDDVDSSIELFKKMSKPDEKLAKSRDIDLINAARAVLASFGLGRSEKTAEEYLEPIKRYDPDTYATVRALVQSVDSVAGPYQDAEFNNFAAMSETVQALWDLSKTQRQIEIDGQVMDRQQAVDELNLVLNNHSNPGVKAGYEKAMGTWEKTKLGLLGVKSSLRRVESWVDQMDEGKINGAFRRYIWNPVSEGATKYRGAKKTVLEKYLEIVKSVEPSLTRKEIKAPEIGYTFSGKQELLGALLHTGNESNFSKLLRGRGWGEEDENGNLDTSRWDQFVRRAQKEGILTKADYDYTQSVWDLLETIKPDAQKVHKLMYGHYFSEITANEFETPFGAYRGGYVPAVADPFIASDAAVREEKAALENLNNSFMFPTGGRGFTKARVDAYARPLALDLRFIPSHIDKVMRFIHIEPHVKEVGRIVMNNDFRKMLEGVDPTVGGDMLVPWLQRTALQKLETPSSGWGGRAADTFFRELRRRTGFQVMVGNVVNILHPFAGATTAALKVEPRFLRDALWEYVRTPKDVTADIKQSSQFMNNLLEKSAHDMMADVDELLLNPSKYERAVEFAKRNGYIFQNMVKHVVDTVVWSGAYDHAVANGANELEAVRSADSVVRTTQGSSHAEDVSRFETGSPFMRSFAMFYSYFNMQTNLLHGESVKAIRQFGLKKGAGRLLYVYMLGFMAPAVVREVILKSLSGKQADPNDDEAHMDEAMDVFFGSQFRAAAGMVPIVGPVAAAGLNGFNNKWFDDRISTSPAVSAIESAVHAPSSVYGAITGDGNRKRAVQDTLTLLGLMTGVPLAPLARPLGYLSDVQQGEAQPTGPIDFTRGLMTGKSGG